MQIGRTIKCCMRTKKLVTRQLCTQCGALHTADKGRCVRAIDRMALRAKCIRSQCKKLVALRFDLIQSSPATVECDACLLCIFIVFYFVRIFLLVINGTNATTNGLFISRQNKRYSFAENNCALKYREEIIAFHA